MIMLPDQAPSVRQTISLRCLAPGARSVCLAGDFNGWSPTAQPLERQWDGSWLIYLSLPEGHHHYQFLVDGEAVLDREAMCVYSHERKEKVSLLALG